MLLLKTGLSATCIFVMASSMVVDNMLTVKGYYYPWDEWYIITMNSTTTLTVYISRQRVYYLPAGPGSCL